MTTIQQAFFFDGGSGQINYWFTELTDNNLASSQEYYLNDHLFDSSGNIIIAGVSKGTFPNQNHWFHKINKNGDISVTRGWNDSSGSGADVTDIEIDSSDNVYAAIGNGRFIKWDSSNNIVYSKQNTWSNSNQNFGDSGVGFGSLSIASNFTYLNYYSIGSNRRTMQVDTATGDLTASLTTSAGNTIFGPGGFAKTSQGNFLCGYVNSPSSNNDNWWMITTTSLSQYMTFYNGGGGAICRGLEYSNGNWYIVGMRQTDNSFAQDPVILKVGTYSGSGNQGVLWARRARHVGNTSNGSYSGQFYDVAIDSLGDIYAVGSTYAGGGSDSGGIIVKYNSSGTMIWARRIYNSNAVVRITKITIDSDDSLWININIGNTNTCGVAKLPSSGLFTGTYCSFTVTDWSSDVLSTGNQSFTHNNQTGSVTFFAGGSQLTIGSPNNNSYTEPIITGSSGQCKSVVATTTVSGQQAYTTPGTYSWTVPANVYDVDVVAVGGGGGGATYPGQFGGGGGGGLGWKNNISVAPGQQYIVVVGAGGALGYGGGDSYFASSSVVYGQGGQTASGGGSGGSYTGDGGGNGGNGIAGPNVDGAGGSGGGAGGYSGNGGAGGQNGSGGGGGGGGYHSGTGNGDRRAGGGGVGLLGEGASGQTSTGGGSPFPPGGTGGSGGTNGTSGGGGATGGNGGNRGGGGGGGYSNGNGGDGGVRIIWGAGRSFPSTNTGNV